MKLDKWSGYLLSNLSRHTLSVQEKAKYLLYTSSILLLFNLIRLGFFLSEREWVIFFSGLIASLCLVLAIYFVWRANPVQASNLAIFSVVVNLVFNAVNSGFNMEIFAIFNYPYIESAFIYLTGLIFAGFLSFRIYQPIVFALVAISVITLEYYNIHLKPNAIYFHDKSFITYVEYFIVLATAGFGTWLNLRINNRLTLLVEQESTKVKKYNERLEEIVQERTSQLEEKTEMLEERNEKLRKEIIERKRIEEELTMAKERAEEGSRAKEQFLSTMSHELRTPLNAVIGMTHLLNQESLSSEQKEYLDTLGFSANQLLELINDVLDFSKIESGKIEVEKYPFEFPEMLSSLVETFRFKAKEIGIDLIFDRDPKIPKLLMGDSQKLKQVFTNLINNAIKFTNEGSVQIRAKYIREVAGRALIRIEVEDTGIGISEENHDLVFEHFSQASSDTSRKYGGTGLGLAITKRLIEVNGGSIQLDSVLGKGSTFTVVLPFDIPSESDMAKYAPEVKKVADNVDSLRGTRILLVEDNLINQKVATKIMSKWNLEIDTAIDGYEAIEKFEANVYDLILMDIQMPNMDGYEATRLIRNSGPRGAEIPIVALTASAFLDVKDKARKMGMNDHISKPFEPEELKSKILSILQTT